MVSRERQRPQHCNASAKIRSVRRFDRLLGEIEESLGRQERAVIALKKAATLYRDNPMTWSRLGEIQALRARWREAEEAYRHASKLSPASPVPLAALASTQLAAQRIEAALATGSILLGNSRIVLTPFSCTADLARCWANSKTRPVRTSGRFGNLLGIQRRRLQLDRPAGSVAERLSCASH